MENTGKNKLTVVRYYDFIDLLRKSPSQDFKKQGIVDDGIYNDLTNKSYED